MDNLDYCKRTRVFFSELRKKHNVHRKAGPIIDFSGALSKNFDETLANWAECYKKLYSCAEPLTSLPTPDNHPFLDWELELTEFINMYYSLKTSVLRIFRFCTRILDLGNSSKSRFGFEIRIRVYHFSRFGFEIRDSAKHNFFYIRIRDSGHWFSQKRFGFEIRPESRILSNLRFGFAVNLFMMDRK